MQTHLPQTYQSDVILESLSIEVTTQCNINCQHCFARARKSSHAALATNLVEEILTEAYRIGYRHLHITGGEPLLWEGLRGTLDFAFEMGFHTVFLNTNGTLLTTHTSRDLAKYDSLSISVSLEGSEAIQEKLRGKGSYRETLRGIQKASEAGIHVSIFTTACKSLLSDFADFAEKLYSTFPSIAFINLNQLFAPEHGFFPLAEELLAPQEFLRLLPTVSACNLLGYKTRFLNNPLANVAARVLGIHWIPDSKPLYSFGSMIVMADGGISLSHSSKHSLGRYESGVLSEIIFSREYHEMVRPDLTICPSCNHSALCKQNGMDRPLELYRGQGCDDMYCQKVLNTIVR
jgi:MoaA/NifB/PqqE/SkfB family radical SAM enzyme